MIKNAKYIFFISVIVLTLISCKGSKLPRPTDEFYVNDFADALSFATKENIVYFGNEVYEDTKKIKEIGGTQIVFATFLLDDNDWCRYRHHRLIPQMGYRQNDMGILTVLFFEKTMTAC